MKPLNTYIITVNTNEIYLYIVLWSEEPCLNTKIKKKQKIFQCKCQYDQAVDNDLKKQPMK